MLTHHAARTIGLGCALVVTLLAAAHAAEPVAQYNFDDGEPHIVDQGPKKYHGTLYGARFVESGDGMALKIDRQGFGKCAAQKAMLFGTGPFSVELWLKLDAFNSGTVIGKKFGQTDLDPGWALSYDGQKYELVLALADGEQMSQVRAPLRDSGWHHVVAVRDGERVTLYIDGQVAVDRSGPTYALDISSDRQFFHLGKLFHKYSAEAMLDDVVVYDGAVTAEHVASQYAAGKDVARAAVVPIAVEAEPEPEDLDPLVMHFRIDEDPGDTVVDLTGHGHDGKLTNAVYLDEVEGRKGVLRFSGEESIMEIADPKSANFEGDMTIEMWVRRHAPVMHSSWATLYGDVHDFCLYFAGYHSLALWYYKQNPPYGNESMLVPMDRSMFDETWSHLAVVVEHPRCRIYHNGELVRDAYLPVPAIANRTTARQVIGKDTPMDLDEFRLYRRALSAEEIAAHAAGREIDPPPTQELAVEPNWYDQVLTLRLVGKNADYAGHTAEFSLDGASQTIPMETTSSRFTATAEFPLRSGAQSIVVRLLDGDDVVATVSRDVELSKPDWIHSTEGIPQTAPAPWTAVEASTSGTKVTVGVLGRTYEFDGAPWPRQIETGGEALLVAPIKLTGRADGEAIVWSNSRNDLAKHSDLVAVLEHQRESDALELSVETAIEFDGYAIIDCTLTATQDVSLDALSLDIPLRTKYAKLCYGDRVLPPDAEILINEWYSGTIEGDQSFRFSPTIWLGADRRGLVWQSESDEDWRNADRQRAIEILPRGEATTFRAHFVDQATSLKAGDSLHYKFAIQATPIKPVMRDAWDLRIVRYEPYGVESDLPDRTIEGRPAAEHLADVGVRHLLSVGCDLWPYPLPVSDEGAARLKRLVETVHAHGLAIFDYQLHQRYATAAPEFDLYGLNMAKRPVHQYIPGNNRPGNVRRGPVDDQHNGTVSQGTVFICPKSAAVQDASVHSVARRLDTYGDDGIYLDGTCQAPPCKNLAHGCGYIVEDGSIRTTYPVFGARKIMQRLYVAVKQRSPDNVLDVHCSWGYNPPALAYGDSMWTGEQWYHLRYSGSDYIAGDLSLEQFRSEFTGWQAGTAAETLHYRLGTREKVAAISLLHDIPTRASTRVADKPDPYFQSLQRIWQMRDRFDADHAQVLYYFDNAQYVQTSPEKVHATLLKHPANGVLAFVSNLHRDARTATVQLDLDALGLGSAGITAVNALTDAAMPISEDGTLTIELDTHGWVYVWLRPTKH